MVYVLDFRSIDRKQTALAGGKGASLGELSRIEGVAVPAGFCVTTNAFQRVMAERAKATSIDDRLDRLTHLKPNDHAAVGALSAEIRAAIEAIDIPGDIAAEIARGLARLGEGAAYAVRSSATAEDMPAASFAGQHDSYLNIVGLDAILRHVGRCWASLFTERAVTYRLRNGIDGRKVQMAVVVQQMVFPHVSGILFTADPVSGHRKVASVEAASGFGDAFVSGRVNADVYKVRDGEIVAKTAAGRQTPLALSDPQVVRLAKLGRRIEAHFGHPQDIEWCLADGDFCVVQSRPITTLFPIPTASDEENHVYLSVGHQQMMTDPMKPLGLSFWQMTTPRPMAEAGGRLFVDVTKIIASPASRGGLLLGSRSDPLIRNALQTILDRGDFVRLLPDDTPPAASVGSAPAPVATDPAIPAERIAQSEASVAAMKREIRTKTGTALMDFILADMAELRRILFDPKSHQVFMTAMDATRWLNEHLQRWLGEKNAADVLTQSVANNITSEMGLALLDVADAIRPYPQIVAFLQQAEGDENFLNALPRLHGGIQARYAIQTWLARYGMRGAGEIDITRPRWSERPAMLLPILRSHIENFEPGESRRRFERGRQEAFQKKQEILERLRALPGGEHKAEEARRMIDRVRAYIGYREYPKFGMVSRYFVYKQALLEEAARLVQAGVLYETEEIFYLRFQELRDVVRTRQVDASLIRERKEAFRWHQTLRPPRVLTSDGECIAGVYKRDDLPAGALAGLAVSAGVVEGRARVVLDMATADVQAGDILVTAYTDPSWTPLFVGIAGLVTEVGGLMTHGAVIAREYGLPAVVGVEGATRLIRDGQRIRVHGTEGYIEILSEAG